MARAFAKVKSSIWTTDSDWRHLDAAAQRLYLLVLSQPEITNCGVVPYVPSRWARMAIDTHPSELIDTARELDEHRFLVVDEDTCEVLVRSFVKHDKVAEQPKLLIAARRQFDDIQSCRIRTILAEEYPDTFTLQPHETAVPVGVDEGVTEPLPEGVSKPPAIPPRARARAASLKRQTVDSSPLTVTPPSSSSPQNDDDEMKINQATIEAAMHVQPTSASVTDDDGPTSDLWEQLLALKPTDDQKSRWYVAVHEDPDRVQACFSYAKRRGKSRVGTLDHLIANGSWPEDARDADVAPGGKGTRSHPRATANLCPTCGIGFATHARLSEHIATVHADVEAAPPPAAAARLAGRPTPDDDEEPEPA